MVSKGATVVDFVMAKTSRLNSFQHLKMLRGLNLKEFHEERRVEHLVPNQIQILVELRWNLLFASD
jgi:hypothetical protein